VRNGVSPGLRLSIQASTSRMSYRSHLTPTPNAIARTGHTESKDGRLKPQ